MHYTLIAKRILYHIPQFKTQYQVQNKFNNFSDRQGDKDDRHLPRYQTLERLKKRRELTFQSLNHGFSARLIPTTEVTFTLFSNIFDISEPSLKKKENSTNSLDTVLTSGIVVKQDPAGLGYTTKMKINETKSIAVDSSNNKVKYSRFFLIKRF
jgi:hypothetical protein